MINSFSAEGVLLEKKPEKKPLRHENKEEKMGKFRVWDGQYPLAPPEPGS